MNSFFNNPFLYFKIDLLTDFSIFKIDDIIDLLENEGELNERI